MSKTIKIIIALVLSLAVFSVVLAQAGTLLYMPYVAHTVPTETPTPTVTPTATKAPGVIIVEIVGKPSGSPLDEYVLIENNSGDSVNMTDWVLRDDGTGSDAHVYTFPSFTLGDDKTVKVWTKSGNDGSGNLYWDLTEEVWNDGGDVAYLRDDDGKLIDSKVFDPNAPTPTKTLTPTAGTATPTKTVTTTPSADVFISDITGELDLAGEYVLVKNNENSSVTLTNWSIKSTGPKYTFPTFTLGSKKTVKVWSKVGTNDSENLYWGRTEEVWIDGGDCGYLRDDDDKLVDEYCYGTKLLSLIDLLLP